MDSIDIICQSLQRYAMEAGSNDARQVLEDLNNGKIMVVYNLIESTDEALLSVACETDMNSATDIRRMVRICSRITSSERSVINSITNARAKHDENIHNAINGRY